MLLRIYTEILAPLRNTSMARNSMKVHIAKAAGFLAALDQSGGSTPGALRLYGIPESAYNVRSRCSPACMRCGRG